MAGWGDCKSCRLAVASLLSLAAAIAWPQPAVAHVQGGEAAGFLSGILHPVSGLDHVLAMISVGLWGAQLGAPALWLLPVTFPMVMAFGGMLGLMGLALPGVEIGIAVSALGLGLAILLELRPPLWGAALVVGFFAVFHGHAHGTGCLHGTGIALGLVHRWGSGRVALRFAGAGVALAGAGFLWRELT